MNVKENLKSLRTTDSLDFQSKAMTNVIEGRGIDPATVGLVTKY